jgi:peptidoglycan/LPS O-acetylase OafA/YrhL
MPNASTRHQDGVPLVSANRRRDTQTGSILPSLTGVRGVAAWWVVIYHFHEVFPLSGWALAHTLIDRGYLAVDLFFVLSGFIISMNYLGQFDTLTWRAYLRFLTLRLGRIYPLHLFMLLVFLLNPLAIVLMSQSRDPGQRYAASYFIESLLLVQNWGFSTSLAWNVPAWSISTEWFAYLVFPCWVALARFASSKLRAAGCVVLVLLALSTLPHVAGGDISANGLSRCVLEFVAGGSVYLIWKYQGTHTRSVSECVTGAGLIAIAAVCCLPVPMYPTAAFAWCALIYGLAGENGLLSRVMSNRLVFQIGEYSYSTYLVHYFVRDWIKFVFVGHGVSWPIELTAYLGVTAAASVILYWLVEVPGRRLVRKLVDGCWLGMPSTIRIV